MRDVFGKFSTEQLVITKPLTSFPTTFHDHGVLSMNGLADEAGRLNYIDPRLNDAYSLINTNNVSYYRAWMQVTKTDEKRLSSIMKISDELAYRLLETDASDLKNIDLPVLAVLRFCKAVGVHPVYLHPNLQRNAEDHSVSYDHVVMRTIVDLLREKPKHETLAILGLTEVCEKDRMLSAYACKMEGIKYCDTFGHKTSPDKQASRHYLQRAVRTVMAENNILTQIKSGMSKSFNYLMGFHQSDVDDGLDHIEQDMLDNITKYKMLGNNQSFEEKQLELGLEEHADIIYGELYAYECYTLIAGMVEEYHEMVGVPDDSWPYLRDEITSGDMCIEEILERKKEGQEDSTRYNFPSFHPDFEFNAKRHDLEPEEVKEAFLDMMERYVGLREKRYAYKTKAGELENRLEIFKAWRNDTVSQGDINLFKNGMLIYPYANVPTRPRALLTLGSSGTSSRNSQPA